ncbi:hypothetical protein CCR85_00695 [Rhodothalassium salexigens]|uniref:serine hydrolase domain-containing protein n=1 Tax=Rhodothalassium salexigens TaxID=1086 RepID=UPI0019124BCF|nr:serine hydrolase domain-containing protein [Rhodothalassium salexigens]MBK5910012.1 hypothetical protein [Rhodothalassium salexigens]MBK5921580.1 hypothetical protein [Rhodothalassium salexigens]
MMIRLAMMAALVAGLALGGGERAAAQGVFLRSQDVQPRVDAALATARDRGVPMAGLAVANGGQITAQGEIGGPEAGPAVRYRLGRLSSLYLVVTALHLVEDGTLVLDQPVNAYLPEPFRLSDRTYRPVKLGHLLTHTGGFARPHPSLLTRDPAAVAMTDAEAARHVARWRSPGIAPDFDPIGLAVLAKAIESATGAPYGEVLRARVLDPLGLTDTGLDLQRAPPLADCLIAPGDCVPLQTRQFLTPVFGMTASLDDLARFAAALTRRDFPGRRTRSLLVDRQAALNPAAPGWTAGLMEQDLMGRRALSLASNEVGAKAQMDLMPAEGIATVSVAATGPAAGQAEDLAAARFAAAFSSALAQGFVPPSRDWPPAAGTPLTLDALRAAAGRYAPAHGSPYLRFAMLERPMRSLMLAPEPAAVGAGDRPPLLRLGARRLPASGAGVYEAGDGRRAVLGTGAAAGFLAWGDTLYVKTPLVSDPLFMTLPVLIATALMATMLVYLLQPFDAAWLRFARIGMTGFFFYLLGVGLDLQLWPTVWLEWGAGWLIVVWRLFFTVGITLLLAVPLLASKLVQSAALPKGAAAPLVLGHLTVLSISALVLVLTSLGWGYAADLSP